MFTSSLTKIKILQNHSELNKRLQTAISTGSHYVCDFIDFTPSNLPSNVLINKIT